MRERNRGEPSKETIGKGELLYLGHPGTDSIFSGYGLTMQEGAREQLVGLLMVDRPRRADPEWLLVVEQTYGECQLVPMTTTGERGIACQMRIEPESQEYLHQLPGATSSAIAKALEPYLENRPTPLFNLWWNEEVRLWGSLMTAHMELPPQIREVFENAGYGCLAAETSRGVVHICHAADKDIDGFPNRAVESSWQLIKMPTAPLIRLDVTILDHPDNPYRFESFLNVAAPDQAQVLYELAGQEKLYLAFYGEDLEYRYTKELEHDEQQWQQLDEIATQAIAHWLSIPEGYRDFDLAKAEFMSRFP